MNPFFNLTLDKQLESMQQVATSALSYWNLDNAELELIKHRENAVFKASLPDGHRYAVRVHRLNYHSDAELHSELRWMEALNASGIETPVIIHATDGALFKLIQCEASNQPFQVDVQEWFEGAPLGELTNSDSLNTEDLNTNYVRIGRLAARMHNQACEWQQPLNFSRHSWDADGLTSDNPCWGRFWEIEGATSDQQLLLIKCRDKLREELIGFGTLNDRYSMIHADLLPENILVNPEGIRLIDFDDAGYGWHLFDLATSLVFLTDSKEFDSALDSLIAGYRQERELPEEHLAMLPTFIFARWTTYIGWAHTRAETETAVAMTPYLLSTINEIAVQYLSTQSPNHFSSKC